LLPISRQAVNYTATNTKPNNLVQKEYSNNGQTKLTQEVGGNSVGKVPRDFVVPKDERVNTLKQSFDDKTLKQIGAVECQTCASRVYQDGSNDPGVSFKSPTHLSPGQAAGAVAAHEQEHVTNEQAKAKDEGREVVSQSVQIFTSSCPECGKSYVSGGLTKTTTMNSNKNQAAANAYQMAAGLSPGVSKGASKAAKSEGNLVDFRL